MKLFGTRIWGFNPMTWPVMTFNAQGYRDNFIRESAPGDHVIFIATFNDEVPKEHQGRVLGMPAISQIAVETLEVVKLEDTRDYDWRIYGDGGSGFKWPKGLLMLQAWDVQEPLLLTDLMPQLPYPATVTGVEIPEPYKARILALPWRRRELPESEARTRLNRLNDLLSVTQPGPAPTSWSGNVERDASGPGWTYAMQWGKHNLWKVGWEKDPAVRLKEFNHHIPLDAELKADRWQVVWHQKWPTQVQAYEVEQDIHGKLAKFSTGYERYKCSRGDLDRAWFEALGVHAKGVH